MPQSPHTSQLQAVIDKLSDTLPLESKLISTTEAAPPSRERVEHAIAVVKALIFPEFFGSYIATGLRRYSIGMNSDLLFSLLSEQIVRALQFTNRNTGLGIEASGRDLAYAFMAHLPEIKRLLFTDIQAIYNNDPAVDNYGEVIACYPVVQAMIHYRVAHVLLQLGVPVLPRIITELAHSATGIDIHPGATIGEYFAIDHGTGVVIGETCVIGSHVTLYQGVTLGAKNFSLDQAGHPINLPRHPVLEDYVTVYSNSSILGRITIGHHSVIGGNVWLTHGVPPHSQILQTRAVSTSFTDGLGI